MNDAIREKLKSLPEKPGCYIMRDRKGRIIYVGKAVDLKRRVSSYFRKYTMRRGDPKVRSLVNSAQDIEWIVLKSEDEALLTEDELIKRHKPRYNILLKDDKRYLGIRADARDPLPRLKACRLVRDDGAEYFGPFPTGGSHVRPVIDDDTGIYSRFYPVAVGLSGVLLDCECVQYYDIYHYLFCI